MKLPADIRFINCLLTKNVGFNLRIIDKYYSMHKMMRFTGAFVLLTIIVHIEVTSKSAGLRK